MPPIDQTTFQTALPRETRVPPPGDLVVTPETLERLKVPDEVLLRPENVIPFLRSQAVKFTEIVDRPEIKALAADIPEYLHDETFTAYPSNLTQSEQQALSSWQVGGTLDTQSTTDEELEGRIDSFVQEMMKEHPELNRGGPDAIDSLLTQEIQETEEERKKFWDALVMAKGNPEAVNLILGYRYAKKVSKQLGRLVQAYSHQVDFKEKMLAEFDLANKRGNPTAADLAGFNARLAISQTDTTVIFNAIQKGVSDLERITVNTATTNTQVRRPLELMIQNMRSGG